MRCELIYHLEYKPGIFKHFIRANKTRAKKEFLKGRPVLLFPCNAKTNGVWIKPFIAQMESYNDKFDNIVNGFEYYNCNSELGYYAKYFIIYK